MIFTSDHHANCYQDEEYDPATTLAPMMYMVQDIYKDTTTGEIKDIRLLELEYDAYPSGEDHSFQILDYQCKINIADGVDQLTSGIGELVAEYEHPLHFLPSPDITVVTQAFFQSKCPMACNNGWLPSIGKLHGMIADYTVPSNNANERAVCPCCITIALMKEHQNLRHELEEYSLVRNFTSIVDFHSRLQPRRRAMGYHFEQFDERQWGFQFDDMLSNEGDSGSEGGDDDRFEQWDEANDPSANAILRPASQATIDALPRFSYEELKKKEQEEEADEEICHVCQEEFETGKVVVQLPCGHFFCDGDCIAIWLRQYNTCPACRREVPDVVVAEGVSESEEKEEAKADLN